MKVCYLSRQCNFSESSYLLKASGGRNCFNAEKCPHGNSDELPKSLVFPSLTDEQADELADKYYEEHSQITTNSYELIRDFMWPTAKPEKEKTCMTCHYFDISTTYCNKRAYHVFPENHNSILHAECCGYYESPLKDQPFPPKVESSTEWEGNTKLGRDPVKAFTKCSCGHNVPDYELRNKISVYGNCYSECPHCGRSV